MVRSLIKIILFIILLASNSYAQSGTAAQLVMPTNAVSTTGTINNLAPGSGFIYFTGGSTKTLTGIVSNAKAKQVWLYNQGSADLILSSESSSSTAANRLQVTGGLTISTGQGAILVYNNSQSRWQLLSPRYTFNSTCLTLSGATVSLTAACQSKWGQIGEDLYNLNDNNVWIALYPCSDFNSNYTNCATNGCTPVNAGDCTTASGTSEGTCTALGGVGQCSWVDPDCTGNYFTSCTGDGYRKDDGTSSKLQVRATAQCSGTAATCTSLYGSGEAACNEQITCTYTANSCSSQGDQSSCEGASCTWGGHYCSGDNSTANTCPTWNGDESTCNANPPCNYVDPNCEGDNSMPNTCPDYNEDEGGCGSAGCSWVPDYCYGDNGGCSGTAAACNGLTSGQCATQDGCTYTLTPAFRAQGDNITTSDGYLQFLKTFAGAPTSGDCDNDSEYGRIALDTTNERLYICNGASRGWDYLVLTN